MALSLGSARKNTNKGKNVEEEIVITYNTYLQARYLLKLQQDRKEKEKAAIKKQQAVLQQELGKEEAGLNEVRKHRMEIQKLSKTYAELNVLEQNVQSLKEVLPVNILDYLHQIRNGLQHDANRLAVKGATVASDETEKIMKTLPKVKETLKKLQDSIGNQAEIYGEVADISTYLINIITRIMAKQERINSMMEEMTSLGLRVCALNIVKARTQRDVSRET